jgi:hypothetical protein
MAEIMTPRSPRWEEFKERLAGPEGCNFREEEPGNPESTTWRCSGGNRTFAKAILKEMGGIDVEASLKFFEENGGFCDCEIFFNVDRR